MRNWLLLSSSFHFLGLLLVFFFSTLNFNSPKKKDVFYIDFIGASTVVNAGPAGSSADRKEAMEPADRTAEPVPEPVKKSENNDALNVPAKKEPVKNTKATPVKTEKKTAKNTQKKADKSDYLQAEDFAGSLPPPSMAAANGFLPEKSSRRDSSGGGSGMRNVSEGIGGGGFRTETDFPYPAYISGVRGKLFAQWREKAPAVSNMQCTVGFTIMRGGSIKNVSVEKSSGNRLFDTAATAAVRASAPFERLPDDFYEDVLVIHVEFKSTD